MAKYYLLTSFSAAMAVQATKTPGGEWIYGAIKEAVLLAPTDQHGKIKLKLKVDWESDGIQFRESIPPREIDETTTSIGKTPKKPKRTCQDYVAKAWPETGADVPGALMEFLNYPHSFGKQGELATITSNGWTQWIP